VGIAGFTLGSGAALLLEVNERRLRDEHEAVGLYPLPVLARVPVLSKRQLRRRTGGRWVMPPHVREAFRTLLVQLGESEGSRVVMVTSASTGDGKTSSAVNLGAAIAAAGDRAIVLDFDLRKPDVGQTLGIEAAPPLASLVRQGAALDDLLLAAPAIPGLSVLSTKVGEGDVALVEALKRRLPELVTEARAAADYVVIDTAPLGEISDALRIVQHVEDVLIVTRPGHTNRENFEVMRDLLERTGVSPKGLLVIGHVAPTTSAYYGYGFAGRDLDERRGPLARVRQR
jgi:Mrp family chromosome partitioning ATPase